MRRPGARFVGVERDPSAVELAIANVALNGLGERVSIRTADIEAPVIERPEGLLIRVSTPFFVEQFEIDALARALEEVLPRSR